jgi:hypothetical protein
MIERQENGQMGVEPDAERLQRDIEAIRGELGGLVGELDHRRHELFDFRLQLRRHAVAFGVGALVAAGLVAGGVALGVMRRRRRQRLPARLRRLRTAVARMIDAPDKVAKPAPNTGRKIAAAGGSAAASVVAKRLAARLIHG